MLPSSAMMPPAGPAVPSSTPLTASSLSSPTITSSATAATATKPLSCANCRQRKIKCDRNPPRCTQCSRSDLDCVFPSRKRTQRPRRHRHNELLSRVSRLESIVGRADATIGALGGVTFERAQQQASSTAAGSNANASASPGTGTGTGTGANGNGNGASNAGGSSSATLIPGKESFIGTAAQGSGAVGGPTARFMSGEFWSNLCDEVEGLKTALEQSDSETDDDDAAADEGTPESSGAAAAGGNSQAHGTGPGTGTANNQLRSPPSSGFILSSPSHDRSSPSSLTGPNRHPSPDMLQLLLTTYLTNVDPLMKLLHRPTVLAGAGALMHGAPLPPGQDALFFAMYFAAVATATPGLCLRTFGEEKGVLVVRYRTAAESALARADYLNSSDLVTLQAFTIYVAVLRSCNGSRPSWALISLAVRLAQALNLHRDGDGSRFRPFEAEMRRRLWWQIIVLDIRASEDRGTEAIISKDSYNTRLPVNINDDDFGPDTTEPLVDRQGPTDMIYSLCTAMSSGIFGYISHPQTRAGTGQMAGGGAMGSGGGGSGNGETTQVATSVVDAHAEEEVIRQAQRLESLFIHTAEPSHYPSSQASVIVQIVILKLWLAIQYPFAPKQTSARPRVPRESMLRTATSIMELSELLNDSPYAEQFSWWSDTWVQWHPLAVALAELCVQVDGPLVDRAWAIVDKVFPKWRESIADTKRGTLWRPIRKLLKKAKTARAEAQMKALSMTPSSVEGEVQDGQRGSGVVQSSSPTPDPPQGGTQQQQQQQQHYHQHAHQQQLQHQQPRPQPHQPQQPHQQQHQEQQHLPSHTMPQSMSIPPAMTQIMAPSMPLHHHQHQGMPDAAAAAIHGGIPLGVGGMPLSGGEQLMASAQAMFGDVPPLDASYFFHMPPDVFAPPGQYGGPDYQTTVNSMDWSPWNEFVSDAAHANANANRDPSSMGGHMGGQLV